MNEKVVTKPWGKEIWIAYPPDFPYVIKKIHTNAPTRSSVHLHLQKQETNYVLQGKAVIYTGAADASVPIAQLKSMQIPPLDIRIVTEGSVFHIRPGTIHRVAAMTDLVTIEVSTPEVDDVIRLADDYDRGDGKIEAEHK